MKALRLDRYGVFIREHPDGRGVYQYVRVEMAVYVAVAYRSLTGGGAARDEYFARALVPRDGARRERRAARAEDEHLLSRKVRADAAGER